MKTDIEIIKDLFYAKKYDAVLTQLDLLTSAEMNRMKDEWGYALSSHLSVDSENHLGCERFDAFIQQVIRKGLIFKSAYDGVPDIQTIYRGLSLESIDLILKSGVRIQGRKPLFWDALSWQQPKDRLYDLAKLSEQYGYEFNEDIASELLLRLCRQYNGYLSNAERLEQFENNFKFVEFLIGQGADVNHAAGGDKMTTLINAAFNNNHHMVAFLLNAGADPNLLNKKGYSALMFASGQVIMNMRHHPCDHCLKSMQLLLDKGADLHVKVGHRTALSIAKKSENLKGVALLEQFL
ncbi:ankyrin repeat domain-containing protein [Marinicella sp. W31]|uniref:ankyrin repeat domain-containing protein n=1 Tax=Marinicella sp. W31 TaxID=3023713 RepID=UPI003757A4E6